MSERFYLFTVYLYISFMSLRSYRGWYIINPILKPSCYPSLSVPFLSQLLPVQKSWKNNMYVWMNTSIHEFSFALRKLNCVRIECVCMWLRDEKRRHVQVFFKIFYSSKKNNMIELFVPERWKKNFRRMSVHSISMRSWQEAIWISRRGSMMTWIFNQLYKNSFFRFPDMHCSSKF